MWTLYGACLLLLAAAWAQDFRTEDIHVPSDCSKLAKYGDHVLVEYEIYFANGTFLTDLKKPSMLQHIHLTALFNQDEVPVVNGIKGMCENATRRISWDDPAKVNTLPIFLDTALGVRFANVGLYIDVRVDSITTEEEYEIFAALRQNNVSKVLEMVENHVGVNAVDEWSHTPLMVAVQTNRMDVVAALLNTRLPKVDVNAAKPSGYTALFYAIEKASVSVIAALLRRGADPNIQLRNPGARGNTPLHFACLLEKTKAAELLLEYGARPDAVNEYGQVPLQLLPADAVRSTKLFFKKMFEEAMARLNDRDQAAVEAPMARSDL